MNWVSSFVKVILTTYKMFNLDDITTKDDNKDWPFRKLTLVHQDQEKQTIYLIQFKKTTT